MTIKAESLELIVDFASRIKSFSDEFSKGVSKIEKAHGTQKVFLIVRLEEEFFDKNSKLFGLSDLAEDLASNMDDGALFEALKGALRECHDLNLLREDDFDLNSGNPDWNGATEFIIQNFKDESEK